MKQFTGNPLGEEIEEEDDDSILDVLDPEVIRFGPPESDSEDNMFAYSSSEESDEDEDETPSAEDEADNITPSASVEAETDTDTDDYLDFRSVRPRPRLVFSPLSCNLEPDSRANNNTATDQTTSTTTTSQ